MSTPDIEHGMAHVVVGGQYGSEGKGAICAYLCHTEKTLWNKPLIGMRVNGPNAGHTVQVVRDRKVEKIALRTVPVAALIDPEAILVVGPGSEVDPEVLQEDIVKVEKAGSDVEGRLLIDTEATVLEQKHIAAEAMWDGTARIGSTGKGIGAARAARAMREADLYKEGRRYAKNDTPGFVTGLVQSGYSLVLEGTQGYKLGLHAGDYPYCTSGDARAMDMLTNAGLNVWSFQHLRIWVVLRTFPIRVAGNSGPLAHETSWETLNRLTGGYVKEEHTTVTGKVRRVGEFDLDLAREALRANGAGPGSPVRVAMTFLDYVFPDAAGKTQWGALPAHIQAWVVGMEHELGYPISLLGTGPGSVIDRRDHRNRARGAY